MDLLWGGTLPWDLEQKVLQGGTEKTMLWGRAEGATKYFRWEANGLATLLDVAPMCGSPHDISSTHLVLVGSRHVCPSYLSRGIWEPSGSRG